MTNDQHSLFIRGPSITARFLVLSMLSLALMVLDHRMNHLEAARSTLSVLVYPIQYMADLPVRLYEWSNESFSERGELLAENQRLRREQLLLEARLQKMASLETENHRLRDLLESSRKVPNRVLIAELLAIDLDPYKHQILLNKGSQDEAFVGQPLLDANGVMGQLIHVGPLSSNAMLITDPNHAIPVEFNRTGVRTVAVGTGNLSKLELPHLANNVDVRVGDLLVTSGLGGRFPPSYPVARVVSVEPNPASSFARITAEPLAKLDRAREVLMVWSGLSSDELEFDPEPLEEPVSSEAPGKSDAASEQGAVAN
ncbi:MAG: rod shape-determining protein MreC [Gammaproteobacteria bacterium]